MLKRPNTLKMHRLLQALLECDPRNAREVRELQADTRAVLGVVPASAAVTAKQRPEPTARKTRKSVSAVKKTASRTARATRK